jgi:hypothetical protein
MENWPTGIITRVSLIRSPIQACALSMMMFSAPRLETLELLDIGAQLWVGSTLVDMLKTRSKTLRFLALRLNHRPDEVGVLDSILEVRAVFGIASADKCAASTARITIRGLGLPTPRSPARTSRPHISTILRSAITFSLPDTPPRVAQGLTHRFPRHRFASGALENGS